MGQMPSLLSISSSGVAEQVTSGQQLKLRKHVLSYVMAIFSWISSSVKSAAFGLMSMRATSLSYDAHTAQAASGAL